MAADRKSVALIDIAAAVISPVLVMLMVGSLVFFLITVLPAGDYKGRLLYTMFFFVFGAVLIARLSIQFGRSYAAIYAAGLGLACFVALLAYVSYPPGWMKAAGPVINLVLMAIVWWSADKLTWDCTNFDEDRKASGRGVLAAAGLDDAAPPEEPEEDEKPADPKKGKKLTGFDAWLERFRQFRAAQRKKPHTPGTWVLYFSLAALPLFALGQSLIDPADSDRRWATLLQMAVYVGSGLGLLVTTTLLGLKRYLEQRGAKISPVLVGSWLGLGAMLIVGFLVVGAFLPRPHSETPWFGMERAGKGDRKASKYAPDLDGSTGKGEGAKSSKTEAGDGKNSGKKGKEGGGKSGEKGSGGGKGQSQGGDQSQGDSQGGDQGDGKGQGNDKSQNKNDQKNKTGKQGSQKAKSDSNQSGKSESGKEQDANQGDGEEGREAEGESDGGNEDTSSTSGSTRVSQMFEAVGSFLKWVVWIVVAVVVIVCLLMFGLKWLSNFTDWAKNLLDWLKGLFGRKPKAAAEAEEEEAAVAKVDRPPPFADFTNPFADGTARRKTPAELVEYTFAAFDSWAWDRDRGRQPGETPMEFAVRIGHEYEDLDEPGFRTADLYVRVLYSKSPLPADTLRVLEALWDQLEAAPVRR